MQPASPFWSEQILFPNEPQQTFNLVRGGSLNGTEQQAQELLERGRRLSEDSRALINGKRAETDFKDAWLLFVTAAQNGWTWGMVGIATMYFDDYRFSPIKKNWVSAEYWLLQAAWLANPNALTLLANFYREYQHQAVLKDPQLVQICYQASQRLLTIADLQAAVSQAMRLQLALRLSSPIL